MYLDGLKSFLVVAQEKSISKAAQRLHVTQPTLSMRIRKLEEGLGFQLIERNWNGVQLTKQGYYFLPYATQLLHDLSNALTVVTDESSENFRVSFHEVTKDNKLLIGIDPWLTPLFVKNILTILQSEYEDVEYNIITRSTTIIKELLTLNIIHIGIYYTDIIKKVSDNILSIEDELVLIYCTNGGLKIEDDLSNIDKLTDKPFILFDNPILVSHRTFTSELIKTFQPTSFRVVDDIRIMIEMIAIDSGFTVVPKSSIYDYEKQIVQNEYPIALIPLGDKVINTKLLIEFSQDSNLHVKEIANKLYSSFSVR